MELKKKWRCLTCGHEFETTWIPSQFVSCPKCGSRNVVRIDPYRGRGAGPRYRRGLCRSVRQYEFGGGMQVELTRGSE